MEDQIKKMLKSGPKSNKELRTSLGLDEKNYDQNLDRTLQKLRKAGLIKPVKGRWVMASVKICPKCGGKGWI